MDECFQSIFLCFIVLTTIFVIFLLSQQSTSSTTIATYLFHSKASSWTAQTSSSAGLTGQTTIDMACKWHILCMNSNLSNTFWNVITDIMCSPFGSSNVSRPNLCRLRSVFHSRDLHGHEQQLSEVHI